MDFFRKLLIVLLCSLLIGSTLADDSTDLQNCKCFEEFDAVNENGITFCRGKKNFRIFGCGEEKPPLCRCKLGGEEVVLDLGELHCIGLMTQYDDLKCEPKEEWNAYFERHPERNLYN
ncbi:hypothetical protein NQ318_016446 [Aromia moschata]|uniref:Uncharacterized protein n=1 Tax=Aromia moschata TaxID=1265417 RepID=A0AAV8Z5N9_9CUCU|nr:hypothetical protein NQ318_016446 [Aromia moschata]